MGKNVFLGIGIVVACSCGVLGYANRNSDTGMSDAIPNFAVDFSLLPDVGGKTQQTEKNSEAEAHTVSQTDTDVTETEQEMTEELVVYLLERDNVNIRSGPGTEYEILGKMKRFDAGYGTGRMTEDEKWAEIIYSSDGETGWIYAEYFEVKKGTSKEIETWLFERAENLMRTTEEQ